MNSAQTHDQTNKERTRQSHTCTICSDSSDGLHFGAIACRACAAFFRRTIARQLKYSCRFANDCELAKKSRAICRACRLAKCFRAGMNPRAVISEYRYPPPTAHRNGHAGGGCKTADESRLPSRPESPMVKEQTSSDHLHETNESELSLTASSSTAKIELGHEYRLRALIESNSKLDFDHFPESQIKDLPVQPTLRRMLLGYERLQRRRDQHFGQERDSHGNPKRTFQEKMELNYLCFIERIKLEINWYVEFVHSFEGYAEMAMADKMALFKHYWINFAVLDRLFDTHRVLGTQSPEVHRMVFQNGDIIDLDQCVFDFHELAERPEVNGYRPWFRHAKDLGEPMRELAPTDTEMMFCMGIMLWKIPPDQSAKLTSDGLAKANSMAKLLYAELLEYYDSEYEQPVNPVERVAEMMRLIAYTEKVTMRRREDIILAKTFKMFKIDVYLEDIFGPT